MADFSASSPWAYAVLVLLFACAIVLIGIGRHK